MKLLVIKTFRDKYTDELYKPSEIIEVDEVRGWEIASNPNELVEIIEEKIDVSDIIKKDETSEVEEKPKKTRKKSVKKQEN